MTATTARGGFRFPEAADNSRNVRTDITNLAQDVSTKTALYVESAAATRPAAGVAGRLHRATDTGAVTWDTGTAWDDVAVSRSGGSTITASAATVRPLAVKGAAAQSVNLFEAVNDAGTVHAQIEASGRVTLPGTMFLHSATSSAAAGTSAQIFASAANRSGLVVRGAASQTANLTEWQNDAGGVLADVRADGTLDAAGLSIASTAGSAGIAGGRLADTTLTVHAGSAARAGLRVRGAASQTANLTEWQNNAGAMLAAIKPTGGLVVGTDLGGTTSLQSTAAGAPALVVGGVAGQTAALADFRNSSNTSLFAVAPNGVLVMNRGIAASATATAGANGALPAAVRGYLTVYDSDGTTQLKIPYYNV